ncbi:MAG TPA: TolC family protein [Stenotrophomonas sp.]|nr:TolC family protein [Stenotrophomonas sp.]
MTLRCLWVLAVAGACGVVPYGHAAESLRLEEAILRALQANPTLQAETARVQAVRHRASREALPAPFVVGAELENVAGSGGLNGTSSAETTLRIGRVLEAGGKRAARQALGGAEVDQQGNVAALARRDIASTTALRFIQVAADQAHIEHADERVQQAKRTRREVAHWVHAARNPDADLHAAEIVLAEAELEREQAGQALAASKARLAASWGDLAPDFERVQVDLGALPALDDFDALAARLPATPQQRATELEARTIEARRRVAMASARPDLELSLGVRRLQATDDQGLVMSVSMPLGNRRRSAFSVAEADADLASLQARAEAAHIERRQQLFDLYQALQQAQSEIASLQHRMLPKAEEAVRSTRRGFEAGRFSFLSLAQAEKTLFELRERQLQAAARYHTLLIEVERLTAPALDAAP